MIVVANTVEDKQAAATYLRKAGIDLPLSEDFQAIGRFHKGTTGNMEPMAVIGYNGFNGKTCCMHVAGEEGNWMNRELLRMAFEYPFKQLGLNVVMATIAGTNHRSLKLTKHIGFAVAYRIKDGYEQGVDIVLFEMRKETCKFLNKVELEVAT
jgi:RimJ/RimL family protein N-acetyltransferase